MVSPLVLLCLAFSVAHSLTELTPPEIQLTCQPLEQPLCRNIGYANTSLPNQREHQSQDEAAREMADFAVLWTGDRRAPCSGAIVHFLCSFYFPFCGPGAHGQDAALRPCRDLCEEVQAGCAALFTEYEPQSISWPQFFNCSTFPEKPLCFGPGDPSRLTVPDGELHVASPSPSTPTAHCSPLTHSPFTMTALLAFALAILLHG